MYDLWGPMGGAVLTDSEAFHAGDYSYLSIDRTQRNLARFSLDKYFNKGSIPSVFQEETSINPSRLHYIHIDLNSAEATRGEIEFLYPMLAPGGVMLFDDYGHSGYHDAKYVIDEFFTKGSDILMHLTTAQAIVFKS
jgi:O-methyltransferase